MKKKISELVVGDKVVSFGYGLSRHSVTIATVEKVYKKYVVVKTINGTTTEVNHSGHKRGVGFQYNQMNFEHLCDENIVRANKIARIQKLKSNLTKSSELIDKIIQNIDKAEISEPEIANSENILYTLKKINMIFL